jgi:uncharacterized protein (TIGR02285 family)
MIRLPVLLCSLLLLLPNAGRAGSSVTWITHPMPPTFISEGDEAGQGVGDQQLRFLMSHLPRYDHHIQHSNFARIWTQMAQLDGVCAQSVFLSPERQKVAIFTRRALREAGYRLYVRTDAAERFAPYLTAEGEIDFSLLAAGDVHGSYYGTRLLPEPVTAPLAAQGGKDVLGTAQSTDQLLQMLTAHRIDFFIAVSNEVSFYHRDDLTAYRIKDVAAFNDLYIACSDKPLGRSIIAAIDAMQASNDLWAEFVAPMQRWHTAEEVKESLASGPHSSMR